MSKTHAVIGRGDAPKWVVAAGLKDALTPGDSLALVWQGKPLTSHETVYDYVLDNEVPFTLFYEDGTTPPRVFREAEFCSAVKVRDAVNSAAQAISDGGNLLFLWDDEGGVAEFYRVYDMLEDGVRVLELNNGLNPIIMDESIPEATDPIIPKDEDEEEEDTRFSKDELEIMTAAAVKRYGLRLGLTSTTKSGIIDELFPQDEALAPTPAPAPAGNKADMTVEYLSAMLVMANNLLTMIKAAIEDLN